MRTHLFRINVNPDAQTFTEDGSFVQLDNDGQGAVTLDFVCQPCHCRSGARGAGQFTKQDLCFAQQP